MPNRHENLTSLFSDIADSIREKTGSSDTISADNFDTAIDNIQTSKPEETFSVIPTTSQQTITPTSGSVFSGGTVAAIQTETKTVTTNGNVIPTSGKYLSSVTVNVNELKLISTEAEMDAIMINENIGKYYKYVGTTGKYVNGTIYLCDFGDIILNEFTLDS